MKCYLCGNFKLDIRYFYDKPDKYLKTIGHSISRRAWLYCPKCELYQNDNGLTEDELSRAYLQYRDGEMRGTTVAEEFHRIQILPLSENKLRVTWLYRYLNEARPLSMLDIGSGLGVFPCEMKLMVPNIYCIEPEPESAKFIQDELGISCFNGQYEKGIFSRVDFVTLVHVLEHIPDPIAFLRNIKETDLKSNGTLFIEVPDSGEFDYLPKEHDEFNSLHLWFFNISTLYRVVKRAGFIPHQIEWIRYKDRNLSRIRMLCR